MLSLPTIESSFGVHVSKIFKGWDHRDSTIIRLACEVLDGSESFLWVCTLIRPRQLSNIVGP